MRAVTRHAHNPAARHWKAVRKISAYLNKATKDLGVVSQRGGGLKLSLFVGTDYADRCNDRRSVSGSTVILRNTAMCAKSTTQHCVALFTSEGGYVSMDQGAETDLLAIKAVLDFIQPHLSGRAIDMYEDNEGVNTMAENHRSKHIDGRLRFSARACEVRAGNNLQCNLGGTTCGHPYEAMRARGVPEAP